MFKRSKYDGTFAVALKFDSLNIACVHFMSKIELANYIGLGLSILAFDEVVIVVPDFS